MKSVNGFSVCEINEETVRKIHTKDNSYVLVFRASKNSFSQSLDVKIAENNDSFRSYSDAGFFEMMFDFLSSDEMIQELKKSNPLISDILISRDEMIFLEKRQPVIVTEMVMQNGITVHQYMVLMRGENYILQLLFSGTEIDQHDFTGRFQLIGNTTEPTAQAATEKQNDAEIRSEKYAWKTSYDVIRSKEITPEMVEGKDYGFFESNQNDFPKELVVNGNVLGHFFVIHYYFDSSDKLVSCMPCLAENLSADDTVSLFYDIANMYLEQYGEADSMSNIYDKDVYADYSEYIRNVIDNDQHSRYIWTDNDGNQLVLSCYKGNTYYEIVAIYNTPEYVM